MLYKYNIYFIFYYITLMVFYLNNNSFDLYLPPQTLHYIDFFNKPYRAPA